VPLYRLATIKALPVGAACEIERLLPFKRKKAGCSGDDQPRFTSSAITRSQE
jgi:hypothetical protein